MSRLDILQLQEESQCGQILPDSARTACPDVPPERFKVSLGSRGSVYADKFNGLISYPEFLDISPFMVDRNVSLTSASPRSSARIDHVAAF